MDSGSEEDVSMVAMVLWNLWSNRNEIVWHQKNFAPNKIVQRSMIQLQQWLNTRNNEKRINVADNPGQEMKWVRPNAGWLKCNVGAAVFASESLAGSGIVVRDSNGCFVAVKSAVHSHMSANALLAEAISLKEALSWIKEKGWVNAVVESDSLLVVQAMSSFSMSESGRSSSNEGVWFYD
ncbi:hypothetical protein DITRI_Ditri14bG0098900 [Diplodiscus trichospermus]